MNYLKNLAAEVRGMKIQTLSIQASAANEAVEQIATLIDRKERAARAGFEEWWAKEGSAAAPVPGEDMEEHAKRMCEIA